MKTIFLILLCGVFSLSVFGQPGSVEDAGEVGVKEISLARDDGEGKAGAAATSFFTTDIPIHCFVQLNSTKAATVKMNFVAVKVAGVKPETQVVTVSYKTNGKQSRVNFTGSPEGDWSAGAYRIDIFIDGKPGGSQAFEIRQSPKAVESEKQILPKPAPKTKLAKRLRKN